MAIDSNTTKGQTAPEEADKDVLPLETLDQLIAEQDPEFKEAIGTVAGEIASDMNIELLDLDGLLAEQEARSMKARLKRLKAKARNFVVGLRSSLVEFVKTELPALAKAGAGKLKALSEALKETLRQFSFKPRKFRLMVFAFAAICVAAGFGIFWLATRGIPEPEKLFLQSMDEIADSSAEFDPAEQEVFYDSVRAAQNVLVIPKLVVNLRRSPGSRENPMMAAEFFVEGNSPDVVVEIKARETEFRDVFMRTMEELSAAEMDSVAGKQKLLERLAREANHLVTKGRVRKVLFKTVVLNL